MLFFEPAGSHGLNNATGRLRQEGTTEGRFLLLALKSALITPSPKAFAQSTWSKARPTKA